MSPKVVLGSNSFVTLVAGAVHTCGYTATAVKCWGGNALGQLGTGSTTQFDAPFPPHSSSTLLMHFVPDRVLQFKR